MQHFLKSLALTFTPAMVLLTLILQVLPAFSYSGPNAQTIDPATSMNPPNSDRQKELIYMVQQDCGSCHGMTLKGGLGPSLLPERMSVLPKQYLMDVVTHGRLDTPMPPWGPLLTQSEIQWIVEQLQLGHIGQKSRN